MLHLTLANLRAKPGRFVATMLAIIVGTGFLAGTLVLSDSLGPGARVQRGAGPARRGRGGAAQARHRPSAARGNASLTSSSLPADALATVVRATGRGAGRGRRASGPAQRPRPRRHRAAQARQRIAVDHRCPTSARTDRRRGGPPPPPARSPSTSRRPTPTTGSWAPRWSWPPRRARRRVTMVGITRYGQGQASSASGDILVSQADAFDFLASGKRLYDAIYVQARPGREPDRPGRRRAAGGGHRLPGPHRRRPAHRGRRQCRRHRQLPEHRPRRASPGWRWPWGSSSSTTPSPSWWPSASGSSPCCGPSGARGARCGGR